MKKRIKILSNGIININGFMNGPVLTPYYESVGNIYRLVIANINVVEVLSDGTEIKLTVLNFNTNNESTQEIISDISEITEEIPNVIVDDIQDEPETVVESSDVIINNNESDYIPIEDEKIYDTNTEYDVNNTPSYKKNKNKYKR